MVSVLTQINQYLNTFFSETLSKIFIFIFIIIAGFVIGKIIGRLIQRILQEFELDRLLERAGFSFSLEATIGTLLSYIIYASAIFYSLTRIGLASYLLWGIAIIIMILIILSTLIGVKDFIPNLLAGLHIYRKGIIRKGKTIKVDKIEGVVQKITLLETELETIKKDRVHIPNTLIIKSIITEK